MRSTGKCRLLRRAFALFAPALLALFLVQAVAAQSGQPIGITREAHDMHDLYLLVLGLALLVFVGVEAALVYAIVRFRRRDDTLPRQIHGSTIVEVIWTVIPLVIVAMIFVVSLVYLQRVEHTADEEDLTIEVTGFQWQWQFAYDLNDIGRGMKSEGTVAILGTPKEDPTLVIPVNEPVEFKLVSNDVIHAFYIREFLYKLDVVPGRDNRFVVTATETGEFTGQCAEFCGLDHGIMRFKLRVVDRAEFDKWVAQEAATQKAARQP